MGLHHCAQGGMCPLKGMLSLISNIRIRSYQAVVCVWVFVCLLKPHVVGITVGPDT